MRARELAGEVDLFAGEISIVDGLVIVGCGEQSALVIEEIQLAGKRAMSAKEWLNGARYKTGDCFD